MAKKKESKLERSLLLVSYILSLFGIKNEAYKGLDVLAEGIKDSWYEGIEEDNTSKYYHLLSSKLLPHAKINKEDLLRYDNNIVRFTNEISQYRSSPIKWKYFQYLSLLFTEIYLDRYFGDRENLLHELNKIVDKYNDHQDDDIPNPDEVTMSPYSLLDLGKVAFWSATGSGKTLLMHVHIKQYLYYARKYRKDNHNKIILITPNEGLSQQHLKEFKDSGITASIFDKKQSSGLFSSQGVVILEISKLADEDGDKTVAVDSFGNNNLVLIDEGHRGTSGESWKKYRDQLSITGFAFEYSATFGQAIHASTGKTREELIQEYGKAILFDYSYKYFYHDGYGKEYRIFNIDNDDSNYGYKYLLACLLSYYQQHLIFEENSTQAKKFLIEKPLWIFVGSSVNAVRKENGKNVSDVVAIIQFFQQIFKDSKEAKRIINSLLHEGLVDANGKDIFHGTFSYIKGDGDIDIDYIYTDMLQKIFNTSLVGANLHVDYLKGTDGEIGLRIGTSEYFGVINVGDASTLYKLCLENNIDGQEKDFSDSLFHNINHNSSSIKLLIGSKKFTEGWSSWRVSTMGLMNIGKGEGSQIIQLFGRGVRLKGYNMSLKRSSRLDMKERPDDETPPYIRYLETLQVYGIRANYMASFKEYLEREGLAVNDKAKVAITIPTISRYNKDVSIKILKKQDEYSFKRMHQFVLMYNQDLAGGRNIELDMYPKIQMMQSLGVSNKISDEKKNETKLTEEYLAFINWDYIFIEIKKYKDEKRMFNIVIDKTALKNIIQSHDWYMLLIPKSDLEIVSFDKINFYQEIVVSLLKKYLEKFFNTIKGQEEGKRLEIVNMTQEYANKNFVQEYTLLIDQDQEELIKKIEEVKDLIKSKTLGKEEIYKSNLTFFNVSEHLFYPLIWKDEKSLGDTLTIVPTHINDGEKDFLVSIRNYIEQNSDKIGTKKIYILRNQSKAGMGFFESHGFYPDFIMWVLDGDKQHITFIDPKGISRMGLENEKIKLHKTIKEKEAEFNDPNIILNSYIISNTPYAHVRDRGNKTDFVKSNVLFQEDADYIEKIFQTI